MCVCVCVSVLAAVDSLCSDLLSSRGRAIDPAAAVTRAVINVICTLVFSSTYRHDDPELQEVMRYNDGLVEIITRGGLVDIYPWLKVFIPYLYLLFKFGHLADAKRLT